MLFRGIKCCEFLGMVSILEGFTKWTLGIFESRLLILINVLNFDLLLFCIPLHMRRWSSIIKFIEYLTIWVIELFLELNLLLLCIPLCGDWVMNTVFPINIIQEDLILRLMALK